MGTCIGPPSASALYSPSTHTGKSLEVRKLSSLKLHSKRDFLLQEMGLGSGGTPLYTPDDKIVLLNATNFQV